MARILSAAALTILLATSASIADPVKDRAKKTADSVISYMMKVYKVVDVDDCAKARDAVTKFGTDNASERDAIGAELAAARADKSYKAALQTEMKAAQGKLKGLAKPKCAADKDVRKAIKTALPAGL